MSKAMGVDPVVVVSPVVVGCGWVVVEDGLGDGGVVYPTREVAEDRAERYRECGYSVRVVKVG